TGPNISRIKILVSMSFGEFSTDMPKLLEIGSLVILGVLHTKRSVAALAATSGADVRALGSLRQSKKLLTQLVRMIEQIVIDGMIFYDDKTKFVKAVVKLANKLVGLLRVTAGVGA